jgi:quercetin dioxygenase-like cupin family protein
MTHPIDLKATAARLPDAWRSTVLGTAAGAHFKVLRMDGTEYPDEVHPFNEALLVLDGVMNLQLGDTVTAVRAGEVFIIPANTPHGVAAGSHGVLVIVDQPDTTV